MTDISAIAERLPMRQGRLVSALTTDTHTSSHMLAAKVYGQEDEPLSVPQAVYKLAGRTNRRIKGMGWRIEGKDGWRGGYRLTQIEQVAP